MDRQVNEYAAAARAIVSDRALSVDARVLAVARLADAARAEADLPGWCLRAVWEEARSFLGEEPTRSGAELLRAADGELSRALCEGRLWLKFFSLRARGLHTAARRVKLTLLLAAAHRLAVGESP